jgi:DNA-binding IclR family transcriptional regulator
MGCSAATARVQGVVDHCEAAGHYFLGVDLLDFVAHMGSDMKTAEAASERVQELEVRTVSLVVEGRRKGMCLREGQQGANIAASSNGVEVLKHTCRVVMGQ